MVSADAWLAMVRLLLQHGARVTHEAADVVEAAGLLDILLLFDEQ